MKSFLGKNIYTIILVIITLLMAGLLTFNFARYKMSYHSDEIFNYGFANSYDSKDIYVDDNGNSLSNEWRDSSAFREYISVQKGEQFRYDKVYQHAANDVNPPLQLFILHTICSFFPDQYSMWFCYAINIVAFIVSIIYMYMTIVSITDNKVVALCSCAVYGLSTGAENITDFLRIYALAVMFGMMFVYYSQAIFKNRKNDKENLRNYILMGISLLLGAYTLHLFLPFAFFICLAYSIYYLCTKNIKVMLKYGLVALAAVIVSFLIFPATVGDMSYSTAGVGAGVYGYPYGMNVRIYFHYLTKDLFGVHTSYFANPNLAYPLIVVGIILFFIVPVKFVFRNEEWYKRIEKSVVNRIKEVASKWRDMQFSLVTYIFTVVGIILIDAKSTTVYGMGAYSNRYVFIIYPIAAIFVLVSIYYILKFMFNKKKWVIGIIFGITSIFLIYMGDIYNNYLYYFAFETEGVTLTELEEDSNLIIILPSNWLLVALCPDLCNQTGKYYLCNWGEYDEQNYLDGLEAEIDKPLYIIVGTTYFEKDYEESSTVESNTFMNDVASMTQEASKEYYVKEEEFIEYFTDKYDEFESLEYIGCDYAFDAELNIYKVNRK